MKNRSLWEMEKYLNVADLWIVVSRPDLCDDRQGLKITGQTQAATASWNLSRVIGI